MHVMKRLLWIPLLFQVAVMAGQTQIDGDTIYVSEEVNPVVMFTGEVQGVTSLCGEGNYNTPVGGRRLDLMPAKSNPKSPCSLLVEVGDRSEKIQHRFTVVYRPSADRVIYDLSSEEKVAAFVKVKHLTRDADVSNSDNSPEKPLDIDDGEIVLDGALTLNKDSLAEQVRLLITAFTAYAQRIANKRNVDGNIRDALELFNNDREKIVETLSRKSGSRKRPIYKYLNDLSTIGYRSVSIQARGIQYVSEVRHVGDHWEGVVAFIQDFTGLSSPELNRAYKDATKKIATIEIRVYEQIIGGKTNKVWRVFLGDIKAEELM